MPARRSSKPAAPLDIETLRSMLDRAEQACDVPARIATDPIGIVRRYERTEDLELVGLLASCLAFGNVKALRASIERALASLGPDLSVLDDPPHVHAALRDFQHRMVRGDELARVLVGARSLQRKHGSLGDAFALHLARTGALRQALAAWVSDLRREGQFALADPARRGPAHVLSDPSGPSACKRLMLYLRWMVRPNDGVDLGLWRAVSPSILVIPLDVHVHRLARNLGMTAASSASWRAAEQITAVLRLIAPHDPVRYDFALCHLGMANGCPERFDPSTCGACAIRRGCAYWRQRRVPKHPAP